MTGDLTGTALEFVVRYGYLAVFVFTFLESSMLFPFLPSEVVLPAAAAGLVTGPPAFAWFVAASTAGVTVGSLVAYHLFGRRGRRALERHGGVVGISAGELDVGRRWFRRWGETTVLWGRLLPVLRSVISIPAGFADMDRRTFALYSAVGGLAFNAAVAALAYYGRRRSVYAATAEVLAANPALAAALLALLLVLAAAAWRYDPLERE